MLEMNAGYSMTGCADIGRVVRRLMEGKSVAEIYEEFETLYNSRGKNPQWDDAPPDEVFEFILDLIKFAEIAPKIEEAIKKYEEKEE